MLPLLFFLLAAILPIGRFESEHDRESRLIGNDSPKIRHIVEDPTYPPRHRYPHVESRPMDYSHCKRPAKCMQVANASCMGVTLPYDTTTLDLIPEFTTQAIVRDKLYVLQGLKHIPKCWAVVQPFLCSLFMPKCINDTVDLPSQELCKKVSSTCRIVLNHGIWPSFINCADDKLFPRQCKNDIREVKFNSSGKCLEPLVPTDNALAVLEGIEGCGMPCSDPLYTQDEKHYIHSLIFWGASSCCLLNFFAVMSFLIDWRSANKYPPLPIFYMNCCFMVSCVGWLLQFLNGNRDYIVCRKDGTLRMSEPNGENLSCVVVFVMVYYSAMAAMIWFVIFAYTWFMTTKAINKIQDKIDKRSAYFHLLAWCLPLMLTVSSMAIDEIDGNYVTGICFVGYNNIVFRAFFLLGPVLVTLTIGSYFLIAGLIKLFTLRKESEKIITENMNSKIQSNIIRIGLFFAFLLIAVGITFYSHHYEYNNSDDWKQSFRDYITCSITSKYAEISECKMQSRPSAAKLQLHLLAPFFFGILISSWVWTTATLYTWIRFFKWVLSREAQDPEMKMKKHKVISHLYAKRKDFDKTGRLSITLQDVHEDPVGLNLNSEASQDFSTTWAAALPKLVTRRGAMVDRSESSTSRRSSVDSQFSVNLRRVAVESRRNSGDSQIALSFSEIKADFKAGKPRRKKKSTGRKKKMKKLTRSARNDLESSVSSYNLQDMQMMMLMNTAAAAEPSNRAVGQARPTIVLEYAELRKSINDIIRKREDGTGGV